MYPTDEVKDLQAKPARKRRSPLGWLGRAALGVLVFLVILGVAGAIYQATVQCAVMSKTIPFRKNDV
jgi:hypothetical protein